MVAASTITCPACTEEKSSLPNWKTFGNITFHICEECQRKPLSEELLLRIGFHAGFRQATSSMESHLGEIYKKGFLQRQP